jgi:uncharacterized protein YecT (DUF1311 family)
MNKTSIRYSYLLLLLLVATSVCAQEPPRHPIDKALEACSEKDPSNGGVITCTETAYKEWDQELNKNYETLMRRSKPAGRQLLKSSQLSWITYRNNEFRLIDNVYDQLQGTMYITMRYEKKMQIVRQRALALWAHVDILNESEP